MATYRAPSTEPKPFSQPIAQKTVVDPSAALAAAREAELNQGSKPKANQ
jgi:hypothetical protein